MSEQNFYHAGMTLADAREELRKADKALRKARKDAANGKPVSIRRAGENYEYWLHKVLMAWERSPETKA